ncbi:MAG: DUF3617 domain-containing protein [Acidobacteria bacterium]|nr:DUF3617 domain-containing protein [Acidobacteriota bacterium]
MTIVKRILCTAIAATGVVLAGAAPVGAQTAPPVKMGLWHGTTVTKMTGINIPPEVAERMKAMGRPVPGAEPRAIETESCLTPEKWKEMFTKAQDRQNCKVLNLKQDSSGMSADMVCGSADGTGNSAKGHMQMSFLSTEKVHGTMHMEAVSARQPQPIVVDMTIDSVYQGADCGGVSPDTPKVIMK